MKKYFVTVLILLPLIMMAQDPASIKWKQIKSDVFQIIYPENYDSVAKRIGSMLLIENDFETHSMRCKPRRISFVLHNQSSMSNGWVAIAPRRVEFFHTPMQSSLSPMDWNASLALHEYRHVIQYEMLRKGFAGTFLHILDGDIGLGVKSLTTPNWFFEGDAVATETALSNAGRGRSPDFSKDFRAQLIEKQKYSYAKAICGSYKDYVPNHYVLGYHLVSYGRYVWNSELWRIANYNSGRSFGFTPFSTGMKMVSGMRKYEFYNHALQDLKTYWINQQKLQIHTFFDTLKTEPYCNFTNYSYPYKLTDRSIIALKTGLCNIPTIVRISQYGDESKIQEVASITNENPINTNGKQIVWVEEFPDIRWDMKSFSDVMIYDFDNQTSKRITHKQHYYAPSISPEGTRIVAVEVTEKALYSIVIIDAETGSLQKRISSPNHEFILTPHWSKDNKTIVCVLLGKDGKSLQVLNSETEKFTKYSQPSFTDISDPFFYRKYIIYTSEHNGINNEIYALDTVSKQCYQVTNSRFGCRFASVSFDNDLLFSTYTSKGDALSRIAFDERQWKKSDFSSPPTDTLVQGLLKDEIGVPNLFDSTKTFTFKDEPYSKMGHIFCPHSWGVGINTNSTDTKRGENDITVMSQNKLGTMQILGGYRYDKIGTSKGYATFFYTGFYPIIQIDYEKGTQGYLTAAQEKEKTLDYKKVTYYDMSLFNQSITLPFNFSAYNYSRYASCSIVNSFLREGNYYTDTNLGTNSTVDYKTIKNNHFNGYYDYIKVQASFSNVKASARKDIQPQWAQTIKAGYIFFTPILNNFSSSSSNGYFINFVDRYYITASAYFPGLLKHHGIKVTAGYTQVGDSFDKNTAAYNPINPSISFARGYINYSGQNAKSFEALSVNYAFTLLNPDLSIPSLVYLKRITANLFYDYCASDNLNQPKKGGTTTYTSFGIELVSENHILNIPYSPIRIGVRASSIDPEVNGTTRRIVSQMIFQYSF